MKKVIPFTKQDKNPVVALDSKGPKPSLDGKIVDHGSLGDLNYEVFARGVIHIYDHYLRFKKDIYIFEDELRKLDFDNLSDGKSLTIQGSGDNDHLVFTKDNSDIKITLAKRDFNAISLLKDIIARGNKKLRGEA